MDKYELIPNAVITAKKDEICRNCKEIIHKGTIRVEIFYTVPNSYFHPKCVIEWEEKEKKYIDEKISVIKSAIEKKEMERQLKI